MALPEKQHSVDSLIEDTLFSLQNIEVRSPSSFRNALRILTEMTSLNLKYNRVGIWFFDKSKKKLLAEDIFESASGRHYSGISIELPERELYLQTMSSARTYAVSSLDDKNVPFEMLRKYFEKFNIKSVLSSRINCQGEMLGVVACSMVNTSHTWSSQERLFIASLGDLISNWMIQSVSSTEINNRQKISLRNLVKELSILCSRASFTGFKEATQSSLKTINNIVHANRTRAIVIEKGDCFFLSSSDNNTASISPELANKIYLLAENSKLIWIPNISESRQWHMPVFKRLGFREQSAVLIAPFGIAPEKNLSMEGHQTHGVLCMEFDPPAPEWNDDLKEIVLCATDSFSILAQYARTKALYRENLEIARASFEYSSVGMALFTSRGKILKINNALINLIGAAPEVNNSTTIQEIVPSLKNNLHRLELLKKPGNLQSYQFEEMIENNNRKKWGLFNISFIPTSNNSTIPGDGYFLLQALDITERKKALLELAEQRTFFRKVIDTNPNFIFAKDINGVFTLANKAVADAYGTTIQDILGKTDADFNSNEEQIKSFRKDDLYVLTEGRTLDHIEEVVTDSDGNIRQLQTVKCPIFDDTGKPVYVLGVSTDITERKKDEEKKQALLAKLEHKQKLESLGVLASGIAHDFNNLLLGIMGNSALSLKFLEQSNPAKKHIEQIISASEHASELTSQLLSYSGKGTFYKTPVELTTVVRETSLLVERITEKKGNLLFSVAPQDIIIDADIGQLRQIILNLITNAADAIETGKGEIVIKTFSQYLDTLPPDVVSNEFTISKGNYGVLEVQDNGCGMTEKIKKNIFDPFFTTKFTGRGLGLASVLGIVRSHGGVLTLQSVPDTGSTFRVYLPVSESTVHPSIQENLFKSSTDSSPDTDKHTVLLIEDENIPRDVCTCMLEGAGYNVISACNGEEGLMNFLSSVEKISLIILDLTMPKLDGKEVLEKIRQVNRNIPVLLMSGYHENQFAEYFTKDIFSGFIQKPFNPDSLEEAIKKLLNEAERPENIKK